MHCFVVAVQLHAEHVPDDCHVLAITESECGRIAPNVSLTWLCRHSQCQMTFGHAS